MEEEASGGGGRARADPPAASSPVVAARKTVRVSDARDFIIPSRAYDHQGRPAAAEAEGTLAPSPRLLSFFPPLADLDALGFSSRLVFVAAVQRARRRPRPPPSRARGRCRTRRTTSGGAPRGTGSRPSSSSPP